MLHHMLIHIGGWTGHRAEIVIAGTDPQKRRKKICKVHQEVADEDAFNGLEFGQDLLLNEAFKLHAEWIAAKADANARGPHRSHD